MYPGAVVGVSHTRKNQAVGMHTLHSRTVTGSYRTALCHGAMPHHAVPHRMHHAAPHCTAMCRTMPYRTAPHRTAPRAPHAMHRTVCACTALRLLHVHVFLAHLACARDGAAWVAAVAVMAAAAAA